MVDDLLGAGKAAEKLVESLAAGVGGLARPWQIRRVAKAEGAASITRAEAELAIEELTRQAHARVDARELQRERNLQRITGGAARQLPEHVSGEPVDPDWTAEFLNCAQDVSNEQMQSLWSRILAGEVAQPGTYSRRTLGAVRVLDHGEAEVFTKLCGLCWRLNDGFYAHFTLEEDHDLLQSLAGLSYSSLKHLEGIGLIANLPHSIGGPVYIFRDGEPVTMEYWGQRYEATRERGRDPLRQGVVMLTGTGCELAPISGAQPHPEYVERVIAELEQAFITVRALT